MSMRDSGELVVCTSAGQKTLIHDNPKKPRKASQKGDGEAADRTSNLRVATISDRNLSSIYCTRLLVGKGLSEN